MKCVIFAIAASVLAGCTAGRSRGYLDREDDVIGQASEMGYSQKHQKVTEAIERLKTDPTFTEKLDEARARAQAANRKRPTVMVCAIENNTGDGRADGAATGQIHKELLTALRKTGMFDVIDPTHRAAMTRAVMSESNSGADSLAIQNVGSYSSSDFVLSGELRRESADDGDRMVYHHALNLQMTDTSTGTVFWSDSMVIPKFQVK